MAQTEKSTPKKSSLELLVGAIVLCVGVGFFTYAYSRSGTQTTNLSTYEASFDRVDGLVEGADVRMAGVPIGSVVALDINPTTYMARVKFSVRDEVKLPKDSSAEVSSDGLLGGKYLALVPGGDDAFLDPGATIVHTQSSVNLESMIGQLIFSKQSEPTAE